MGQRYHSRKRERGKKPFNSNIYKILGQIGNQLGDAAERHFDESLRFGRNEQRLPWWLINWRREKKNSAMDLKGIDFTIMTDRGEIPVQVKSSRRNAERFESRRSHLNIRVVVVDFRRNHASTLARTIQNVSEERRSR